MVSDLLRRRSALELTFKTVRKCHTYTRVPFCSCHSLELKVLPIHAKNTLSWKNSVSKGELAPKSYPGEQRPRLPERHQWNTASGLSSWTRLQEEEPRSGVLA